MFGKMVSVKGSDGTFGGYLATPSGNRGAGVIVIQEIFGVNIFVREVCDRHAAEGRFALAPDLFWRLEPNVQLNDKYDADWKKAFDLLGRFDFDRGVNDIQSSITYLRKIPGCIGKVGAVGYCMGGLLAYLTATRTDSDASVSYYGVNIETKLPEAKNIRHPLMLHIAGKDEYVPSEARKKIMEGLKPNALVTLHLYPEMDHAFARPGGQHYDRANAELANGRTQTFFRQHLG